MNPLFRLYLPLQLCLICIVKQTNLLEQSSFSRSLSWFRSYTRWFSTCKHDKLKRSWHSWRFYHTNTGHVTSILTSPNRYSEQVSGNNVHFPWICPHSFKINIINHLRMNGEGIVFVNERSHDHVIIMSWLSLWQTELIFFESFYGLLSL